MPARPAKVWDGTQWVDIGPQISQAPIAYQASQPASAQTGDIWIDSDDDVPAITPDEVVVVDDFIDPYFLMGA